MPASELPPGTRLGAYRIVRTIGRGGMGVVHEAREAKTDRAVALKVLAREVVHDPSLMARFHREERALRAVAHGNVVSVLGTGEDHGLVYLALELVTGGSLADRLESGRLPWREVARLGAQVARALGAVHAAGLVHRDVKPANILLDEAKNAKLTDFGLVRPEKENLVQTIASLGTGSLTAPDELVGTFEFMSPEQAEGGGKNVDARSDLYGLGVTLHVLLTGRPLFSAKGYGLVRAHLMSPPVPPSATVEGIPAALDELVLALLAKKKTDRPRSAIEVASRLDAIAGGAAKAKHGRGLIAGAAVAVALALALALALVAFIASRSVPAPASPPLPPPRPPAPPAPPTPPTPSPPPRAPAIAPIELDKLAPVRRWYGSHHDKVMGCAFSPRGDLVATASMDGTIGIWDADFKAGMTAASRVPRPIVTGCSNWCVAFVEEGRRVVSAGYDGKVHLSDPRTLRGVDETEETGPNIEALAVSNGSPTRVVVGTAEGALEVWQLAPNGNKLWREHAPFPAHKAPIGCVAFWPDDRHVLSGGEDGLRLSDLETATTAQWATPFVGDFLPALAVAPGGKRILSAAWDRPVGSVWDENHGLVTTLEGHTRPIRTVAFSPDGTLAATGSQDRTVRLWRTDTWKLVKTLPVNPVDDELAPIGSIAFSPDGRYMAVGSDQNEWAGLVTFWELAPRD